MRRLLGCAALAALVALPGCGGDEAPKKDPFTAVRPQPAGSGRVDKAAPRWERVTVLRGSGRASKRFKVARSATQWRARWTCERGTLRLSAPSDDRRARGRGKCPGRGELTSVTTGDVRVKVDAGGPWRVVVEQQVETALHERRPASVASGRAKRLRQGRFYEIERRGRGKALLYRLPNGRLALRLQDFATSANTDLFVWLSTARKPKTTEQAFRAPHIELGALKSTLGDQNYLLPASVTEERIRSIVIWCEPVRIAYTAASL